MKPRRVIVTLEVETNLPLATLRSTQWWCDYIFPVVIQAQANVVRREKPKARKVRRRA